ncbi:MULTISPECIES: PIN domain-containing protein [unclassified Thioalkalivibrio]|uniref:PIN domain-containing protein n=1 Tax=unclassified Thioalkalivibrio TaxID=2621013 RepID=UPI00036FE911|nr:MULTISPECIES: PIN domain-containing protein [unclassified Thioalkalivibrio]
MSDKVFVDTNILLYAHDLDAGDRHDRAEQVIRQLWDTGGAIISIQVLQEFYVNVTRKVADPLPPGEARRMIEAYRAWQVECPDTKAVLRASEIQERNRLSFWDSMIVATACQGGATVLLSEDLNHSQIIEGIRVENPLLHPDYQ